MDNSSSRLDPMWSHVTCRLLEFFAHSSPWPRRLWDTGTILALRELHEASQWTARRVLSVGALSWFRHDVERLAGRDRGVGGADRRRELQRILRSDLAAGGRDHRELQLIAEAANSGYLLRWRDAVAGATPPAPERLSRAMATHLTDRGFDAGFLHRWARRHQAIGTLLLDMLEDADALARQEPRSFEVLVPFTAVPDHVDLAGHLQTWRAAADVSQWLVTHGGAPKGVRQNGGFVYTVQAMDPYGAPDAASEGIERLRARAGYARGLKVLRPEGRVWVAGHDVGLPLERPERGAFVLSLTAERTLYELTARTAVDDALVLAAPLNRGAPGPAVSGGWAAIESLLVAPEDPADAEQGKGAVACGRLADLVACSWPRAELTTLSFRYRPAVPDALVRELAGVEANVVRSRMMATALARQDAAVLAFRAPEDLAAGSRMTKLLKAPRPELHDVRGHVETAMRRFYRQRNILMHGGDTNSVALGAALRTAAPLIGAGLDRVVHASLRSGTPPLVLAGRARLNLSCVGGEDGVPVTDLLD